MNELKIVTNNHMRELLYGYDLPEKIRKDFDYLNDEEFSCNTFIKYRNQYHDLSDFMRTGNNESLKGWDGIASDSYFSGLLIKLFDDGYKIATYYS